MCGPLLLRINRRQTSIFWHERTEQVGGRGSRPGERRGGRKAGTPNKRTVEVAQRLEELGCDPIEGMARLAMDDTLDPTLRGRMFSELAQYVAPKRRAVEHSDDANSWEALLDRLAERESNTEGEDEADR
jgi:hypothetical protein